MSQRERAGREKGGGERSFMKHAFPFTFFHSNSLTPPPSASHTTAILVSPLCTNLRPAHMHFNEIADRWSAPSDGYSNQGDPNHQCNAMQCIVCPTVS